MTLRTSLLRTVRLGLVLVLVLGAACVNSGQESGSNEEASTEAKVAEEPSEPTTITFASWVGDSPQFKKFAKEFNEEYPNITVEFQNVPAERATDKLTTQVAGGNPPDVAFMDASAVESFATRDALVNLEGYIAGSEVIVEEDYVEGFKTANEVDGEMYALPFDGETTGLFYRTDMFEDAGLSGPPETWEEFEEYAAALTDKAEKEYGFIVFAPEAYYYWYPFLWQAGGDLLSEDESEIAFDDPEGQEAAEFYVGLAKYSPPDYLNSNSWDGRVAFASGKVGMYMAGSWFGGEMQASFPEINGKWDVAPLPEGPQGCATTLAGDSLGIFSASQNQDAAWLWIEFLSREENMKEWTYGTETSTLLPPRTSLLDDPELGKHNPWLEGFAENMECAVTNNITVETWPEIETALNENLGEALYGEMSATEAVTKAGEKGEELLQQAR